MSRMCYLKCLKDSHEPVKLPHNVEVIVGRSKITKIKDPECSRQQISLKADYDTGIVHMKQIGMNSSGLNGFATTKDEIYKVEDGSKLEILFNKHIHLIEFCTEADDSVQSSSKRKLEESNSEERKKKKVKMEPGATESTWDEVDRGDLYVYTAIGVKPSTKIAAFDMDGTLIKTKSGKVHPVDINDWQLAFPTVQQKLKDHFDMDYKIVIFSNQASIGNGKVRIEDFKKKIENVVEKLKVPIQAYISTGKGFYRKPMTGMWEELTGQKNNNLQINMDDSFYCGDAAGRVANWAPGKKKDHSLADKLFAENLNLKFYTPEKFFLGHNLAGNLFGKPEFDPKAVAVQEFNDELIGDGKEILVLVGFPGSGKSFLAKQIEEKSNFKYSTVCRDVLGSWQKCAEKGKKLLQENKSVIVDSTNPDKESRARWVSLAKECGVRCRCVNVTTTMAHARHNNKFRELLKTNHLPVNDIIFHTHKNKYTKPKTDEGFAQVIDVDFSPTFDDEMKEKIYKMHLLEK